MKKNLAAALVFSLALGGCAHVQKVCQKVATADDAYAMVMQRLREAGLLAACRSGVQEACKLQDAVLDGQRGLAAAYGLCYEDTK